MDMSCLSLEGVTLIKQVIQQEIDTLERRLKACENRKGGHVELEKGLLHLSLRERRRRLESVQQRISTGPGVTLWLPADQR